MTTVDVFRVTDQLDQPTLESLITRLEARGKHARFTAMLDEYLEAMAIDSAGAVLDLGCGTGLVARTVARRKSFAGRITAIDSSSNLVAAATRLAEGEGTARATEFVTGDAQALEALDASFDAAVAHTLLSHVVDPAGVLREVARVVKPGGMVGIFDGDYASLTFGSDAVSGRSADEAIINAIVTNPCVMRQMPQLLLAGGLRLETSFSYVIADVGKADFWATAIQTFSRLLPRAGTMSEADADAWAKAMVQRSDQGTFFAASNYYSYVARRL
jgi:ubiquinone/menaquinone biosynthesis C-methylase UbiE